MMQATSRESLRALREHFDELTGQAGVDALYEFGDELSGVVGVLLDHRSLRKKLADPAAAESAKDGLVSGVLRGKVGDRTLQVVRSAVTRRWSRPLDLVDSLEELARRAILFAAERTDALDETEDELFRFGRVLAAENRLRDLLGDESAPAGRRVELLHRVLEGKAGRPALALLDQPVRRPRGNSLDVLVEQLAELAAARREHSVAHVTAAAPLSSTQEERLAQVLTRVYGRTMSVQVDVDPDLLGGLVVRVGDEVIDGSVANRLAKASQGLPT
jgi:F-type H+-transporting ATPase subunit delta